MIKEFQTKYGLVTVEDVVIHFVGEIQSGIEISSNDNSFETIEIVGEHVSTITQDDVEIHVKEQLEEEEENKLPIHKIKVGYYFEGEVDVRAEDMETALEIAKRDCGATLHFDTSNESNGVDEEGVCDWDISTHSEFEIAHSNDLIECKINGTIVLINMLWKDCTTDYVKEYIAFHLSQGFENGDIVTNKNKVIANWYIKYNETV